MPQKDVAIVTWFDQVRSICINSAKDLAFAADGNGMAAIKVELPEAVGYALDRRLQDAVDGRSSSSPEVPPVEAAAASPELSPCSPQLKAAAAASGVRVQKGSLAMY